MTDLLSANSNSALMRAAELKIKEAAFKAEQAKTVENLAAIEDAAKDFEAVFLTEMLKPMFSELQPDPMFGGGKGEEVFQSFMIDEYGKMMADRGGIGIAEHVKAELIRIQEDK